MPDSTSSARMRATRTMATAITVPLELKVAGIALFAWALMGSSGSTIVP